MADEHVIDLSEVAGFQVHLDPGELTLTFAPKVRSVPVARRRIEDIRQMLPDEDATGPDPLYSVYMDLKVPGLTETLNARGLSYGAVVDAPGTIGREFVRSQGHTHSAPAGSDLAYLEIYEFWYGSGIVYLQDRAEPDTNEIYLIHVVAGDKVIIPPGWVHIVVNLGSTALAFGALYASDATLIYDGLRKMNGAAWRILADGSHEVNPTYDAPPPPVTHSASEYPAAGICRNMPVLLQALKRDDTYDYVVDPANHPSVWQRVLNDLRENP